MFKMIMTSREFVAYMREGIYSLRFAVLILSVIILLFIIVQVCEMLYAFLRFQQSVEEDDELGPTEVIVKNSRGSGRRRRSRAGSRKRQGNRNSRPSKKAIVQFSLSSGSESSSRSRKKENFDEKSVKILKSSSLSTSLVPPSSPVSSKKLEKIAPEQQQYFGKLEEPLDLNAPQVPSGAKDSLMVVAPTDLVPLSSEKISKENSTKLSLKPDEAATGKEKSSLSATFDSPKESETQMVSGSTLSTLSGTGDE